MGFGQVNDAVVTQVSAMQSYAEQMVTQATAELTAMQESIALARPSFLEIQALPTIEAPTINTDYSPTEISLTDNPPYSIPVTITPYEAAYQGKHYDNVNTKIDYNLVNGGTGLAPDVEDQIWRRKLEREDLAVSDAIDTANASIASRGWRNQTGMTNGIVLNLIEKQKVERLDASRDVAIKQAELAQTNDHFYVDKGIAHDAMLIQQHADMLNRAIQFRTTITNLGIAYNNLKLSQFASRVQRFAAEVGYAEAKGKIAISADEVNVKALEATAKLQTDALAINLHAQVENNKAILTSGSSSVDVAGKIASAAVQALNVISHMSANEDTISSV